MRILDGSSNKALNNISLYLTLAEAMELRDSLDDLIKTPSNNHAHIPSDDYKKILTTCIYDLDNLSGFDERSITLIKQDL